MNSNSVFRMSFSAVLAAGLLAGCALTPSEEEEAKVTRVLMIGNSFSICVLRHLPQIAKAAEDSDGESVRLDLASLYIGGCSLKQHWENVSKDTDPAQPLRPYRYDRFVDGEHVVNGEKRGIREVLKSAKWDVVTIQQASHDSWKAASYSPYGGNLIAVIRELAPQAEIRVQETWSYTPWDARLQEWGIDEDEMYERLHEAYGAFAKRYGLKVIPFGTAVQEWRRRLPVVYTESSFGGDVVGGGMQEERDHFKRDQNNAWKPNCDVFHLGRRGEYFQALVWAVCLLDVDLDEVEYRPTFVTEKEAELMKNIATEMGE